jgi:hypothetical protein
MYRPGGIPPFFCFSDSKAASRVAPFRYPLAFHFPSSFLWRKSKITVATVDEVARPGAGADPGLLDQAFAQADRDRMGAVAGLEPGEDVLCVRSHGFL